MWNAPKKFAKSLLGSGVALVLGTVLGTATALAASGSLDGKIKFDFDTTTHETVKVNAELDVSIEQATEADVVKAVKANLGDKLAALSEDDQTALLEEAVSHAAAKLQTPWAPEHHHWHFSGPFGTFDRMSLQRGYQVYREVCASCHSMKYLHFRNLSDKGGPEFTEAEVKALAAEFTVTDGPDDQGDMFERPGKPSDPFPVPYANENIARVSNGGALPPDLSLMAKARHHGPDYISSLMRGYDHPVPPLLQVQPNLSYNPYFAGRQIGMPKQLVDDMVEYADGTPATADQMAHDVAQFLMWAAEPKMEQRKAMAVPVLIYMFVLAIFLYMSYKRIWRDVDH